MKRASIDYVIFNGRRPVIDQRVRDEMIGAIITEMYQPPPGAKPLPLKKRKSWYDTHATEPPFPEALSRGINNQLFRTARREVIKGDHILAQIKDKPDSRFDPMSDITKFSSGSSEMEKLVRSVGHGLKRGYDQNLRKREKFLRAKAHEGGYKPDSGEIRRQAHMLMPRTQVGDYQGARDPEWYGDSETRREPTYGFDSRQAGQLLRQAAQKRLRGQRLQRRMEKRGLTYTPAKKGRVTRRMNLNRRGRRGRLPEGLEEGKRKINWTNVGRIAAAGLYGAMSGAGTGMAGGSVIGSAGEANKNLEMNKEFTRRINAPKEGDPRISGAAKKRVNMLDPKPFVDARRVKAPKGVTMVHDRTAFDAWAADPKNMSQDAFGRALSDHARREYLPKGESTNAAFMPPATKEGTPAVLAPKTIDHRVVRHEIGHALDLKGTTQKEMYKRNTEGGKVSMRGSWKTPQYGDEVRAWDKGEVPTWDPVRKLGLGSYETSNKSAQKGKRGAAAGALFGALAGGLGAAAAAAKNNPPLKKEDVIEGILWEMAKKDKVSKLSKAIIAARKKGEKFVRAVEGKKLKKAK